MSGRADGSSLSSPWSSDAGLAAAATLAGLSGATFGVLTQPQPFAMLPGMDGALTMGVLGFAFAMLHGLRYRDVLRMLIPVVGVQIGGCLVHGESVVAVVGLELTFVGVVGLVMTAVLSKLSHDRSGRRRGRPTHTAVATAAMASPGGSATRPS